MMKGCLLLLQRFAVAVVVVVVVDKIASHKDFNEAMW